MPPFSWIFCFIRYVEVITNYGTDKMNYRQIKRIAFTVDLIYYFVVLSLSVAGCYHSSTDLKKRKPSRKKPKCNYSVQLSTVYPRLLLPLDTKHTVPRVWGKD
jgi:hypothetical protein